MVSPKITLALNKFILILFASLMISCSSSRDLSTASKPSSAKKINYSITYMIHGDANYLYHDSLGIAHQADEKILAEAKQVAQKATHGEVLIFHQRPEKKILWLFPKKDRQFFYYRNGTLVARQAYSPAESSNPFLTESQLYRQYKSHNSSEPREIFLYFGHEIPSGKGTGYYNSIPKLPFNTDTFVKGLSTLRSSSDNPFDLAVLSTCNNGSPDMVHALQPYTHTLLASPQNLHLSHIDTKALSSLETNPDISSTELATELAEETYRRLEKAVQTVISLSVYDMEKISSFIQQVDSTYRTYLQNRSFSSYTTDNTDCASLSIFEAEINFSRGVKGWYRPPRFGQKKKNKIHSGWGCKK